MDEDWKLEFVRLLSSSVHDDWTKARDLRRLHIPKTLFRYRRCEEYSFDALEQGAVWLSAAGKFNDVHDTSVRVTAEPNVEEGLQKYRAEGKLPANIDAMIPADANMMDAFESILKNEVEKQLGSEVAKKAEGFFRMFARKQSDKMTRQATAFLQAHTKVACFCEFNDQALLWAHYADSCKGYCVEYDFSKLPHDDLRIHWLVPVVYSDARFDVFRMLKSINPFLPTLAAIHKGSQWAYECEWRWVGAIADGKDGRLWLMPATAIYLGERIDPAHRARLLTIATKRRLRKFEMRASTESYTLEAVPIP